MSSTRDSLSGKSDNSHLINTLRSQVKEYQDMANDFQKMASMNREAISLMANSSPHSKDKLVANLRAENNLIFSSLSKSVYNNKRLEELVEEYRLRADNAELVLSMSKQEFATHLEKMILNLSKPDINE
jgi:ribosomal protein L16 Arg81 hydroxylase